MAQQCQVHFILNFTSQLEAKDSKNYLYKLQDIFTAPDIKEARSRKDHLVEELEDCKPQIANWIDDEINQYVRAI